MKHTARKLSILLSILLLSCGLSFASTTITSLKVQDTVQPLAIEDLHPTFSWIMNSTERGQKQSAYRITVRRDSDGSTLWDTGKVASSVSTQIPYMGVSLQPETAYSWTVEVWDKDGSRLPEASSTFETGLLSPRISSWGGAKWIGSKKPRLDAVSDNYFEIQTQFQILKGDKASFIFGADDFRFLDAFQNTESLSGENYVRVEFDFSKAGEPEGSALNIYRVGYDRKDRADKPFISVCLKNYPDCNINTILTRENMHEKHDVSLQVEASCLSFVIDGKDLLSAPPHQGRFGGGGGFSVGSVQMARRSASKFPVGPWGSTHDYNTAPHLAKIGFAVLPSSEVVFSGYRVLNLGQSKDRVVFDARCYGVFNGIENLTLSGDDIILKNTGSKMTYGYKDPSYGALTMLRSVFSLPQGKKIIRARLLSTAMGSYEAFINGERMGQDWFTPGDSQYRETMGYHIHDVTGMLQEGKNCIGVQLAPGWYTGPMTFTSSNFNFFGDYEAFLMRLVVTFEDGSRQVIVSDPEQWKTFNEGPVRSGNFFQGERYDARYEAQVKGWKTAAYDDSLWQKAEIIQQRDWVDFDLMARYDEPVRLRETLTARQVMPVYSKDHHTYIYDMGVNMVGVPSITIPEGWLSQGDEVIIRYGEMLYPGFPGDERLYQKMYGKSGKNIAGRILYETYRAALATDFFIASGSGSVTIQPSTTYRGYQYIQITIPGHEGPLPLENIKGLVLSSDALPGGTYQARTVNAETSRLVNQLFKNIQRSQLGNFFTIPTDCPQRNERMGWTGDAQAYTRTSTYNSDTQNFMRQWMVALRADQGIGSDKEVPGGIGSTVPTYNQSDDKTFANGTTWAAAVCMVPWQLYIQYGNTQIISENMEAMMSWLNGMDFYDFSEEYPHLSSKASGLADWLAMDSATPADLVNNAIYIYMMEVTARMADAIGRGDLSSLLKERRSLALKEWNQCYVDPETGKTRNASGKIVHSQASYATPLNFNCFDEINLPKAQQWLSVLAKDPSLSGEGGGKYPAYTITTGFSGTPNILPSLSRAGRWEDAFRMFTCKDYTSWLYPVSKGATSVWERWNGFEGAFGERPQNNMNSFNHFALGAVGQWMYEYQLGITSDYASGESGYAHFILQPGVGADYTSLEGSYASTMGTIRSAYKADGKGRLTSYEAVVPANTTATLYLPVFSDAFRSQGIEGAAFKGTQTHNGVLCLVYELESGTWNFEIGKDSVTVR